jgi:Na+/proline symporter
MLPTHILEIDIAIFVFFFLVISIVGINYRGLNNTFREYALGDRKFPTYVLTFTIVATWLSGSLFFGILEGAYGKGIFFILSILIGIPGGLLIAGKFIGPRMGKFMGKLSAPDMLGTVYGIRLQAIFAICFVLTEIGYVAVQFKVIARAINTILHCDPIWAAVVSAIIVIVYSAQGGVRSVTFTDVVQFITFCVLVPILLWVVIANKPTGLSVIDTLSQSPNFNFNLGIGSSKFLDDISFGFYMLLAPIIGSGLLQRMLMASSTDQIKRSISISTIIVFVSLVMMITIGVFVLIEKPNLEANKIVEYLADRYPYEGLKGLFAVGIVALSMSTADSTVNASAVMIANDIMPFFGCNRQGCLRIAKRASYVLGLLSLLVALMVDGLLDLIMMTANFSIPIIFVPFVSTVFGFHTTRRVVYMSIAAGTVATLWGMIYIGETNAFIPGLVMNAVVFFGAHYLLGEKGGPGHNKIME